MHEPSLESLLLTKDELRLARQQIEKMAYEKWEDAGHPYGDPSEFWIEAEREWIAYFYVPDRKVSGADV